MAFDIIPEADPRFKFIDTRLDALHGALNNPALEIALGDDRTHRLRELADMLVVPNLEDGVLTIPEEYKEASMLGTMIPFFALNTDEVISYYDPNLVTMHREQVSQAARSLAGFGLDKKSILDTLNDANKYIFEKGFVYPLNIPDHMAAMTHHRRSIQRIGRFRKVGISGRPLVLLDAQKLSRIEPDGSAEIHELVHVDQTLREPVTRKYDERISGQELEAYHTQHLANIALNLTRYKTIEPIYDLVEAHRTRGNDPFKITRAMMKAIRQGTKAGIIRGVQE